MSGLHGYVNIVRLKVVDDRGRTLCYLQKKTDYGDDGQVDPEQSESWGAPSKPMKDRPEGVPFQQGRIPRAPVSRRGDHLNLELPGLTVNLRKIGPKLDRFAAAYGLVDGTGAAIVCNDHDDAPAVSVSQLRNMHNMR